VRQAEPPSCTKQSVFMIGRNGRGQWVVQDQRRLRGGLFVSRAEALKFAMFENGNRPGAAIMLPGTIELDFNAKPDMHLVSINGELQRAA